MAFRPKPQDQIQIEGKGYTFTEHPSAPNMAYGQTGRRATVYQVCADDNSLHALKVFTVAWRDPRNAASAEQLHTFASLPGLQVCQRLVIKPEKHSSLITFYPELDYAVLMDWVSGETWQEVMLNAHPLTIDQSREVGLAFLNILKQMERAGVAHCDLSGPNVMLKLDPPQMALVDVEDLYGPGLARPERVGGGSSGYAHKTAPRGLWRADADRFAGAILLAEMLGWCDERVRRIAYGEQYFDPGEVQQSSERYQVLLEVLRKQWGTQVAEAFAKVWFSETLDACPSFQEWERLLNPVDLDRMQAKLAAAERLLGNDQLDEAIRELDKIYQEVPEMASGPYARALMTRGATRERGNDLAGALLDYQLALEVAPEGGLKDELKLITEEMGIKISRNLDIPQTDDEVPDNDKYDEPNETESSVEKPKKKYQLLKFALAISLLVISFFLGRITHPIPLYFASNRSGNFEIYQLINGKAERVTYSHSGKSWDPVTSPTGILYFTSDRDGKKEVYNLTGTEAIRITHTPGAAESWSPYFVGDSLYFVSNRSGKNEIWKLTDGKPYQVTHTSGWAISTFTK